MKCADGAGAAFITRTTSNASKPAFRKCWDTGDEWEDTFPLRGKDGTYRWFLSRAKPLIGGDGTVWRWFGTNTDITVQRDHEQRIQMLMNELGHRAKNMIAVVQALVHRTADRDYAESLTRRLHALARNQDLLTKRNWGGTPLGELIHAQLATIGDAVGTRVTVSGALDILVNPSAAETLGLALHELSTNAIKYGAMSGPAGTIHIGCDMIDGDEPRLRITWQEQGGPPVAPPAKSGFGTVMIDRNPRWSLGADIEIDYPPTEFVWRLSAPLERVNLSG